MKHSSTSGLIRPLVVFILLLFLGWLVPAAYAIDLVVTTESGLVKGLA